MIPLVYKINPVDNVATALSDLEKFKKYEVFEEGKGIVGEIETKTRVPKWYKVALVKIPEESPVLKFGYSIGLAVIDIEPGTVVHLTNIVLSEDYSFAELVERGFIIGRALVNIDKGDSVRIGKNVKPLHPAFYSAPYGTKVGIAAKRILEDELVRLGNIIDVPHKLGWNEKYRSLVKEFYKFLNTGVMSMSRV
ncbi:MAG: hypothetical protein DRJ52_08125 [Thermoprotei archaeon]|nr:MAG: hypothetical protein DRJ52_08125 [Thermoprotei archaeon]RLF00874.1 MAG: hypothetical protein DRJ63_01230 [Thermoprotei archaeon]